MNDWFKHRVRGGLANQVLPRVGTTVTHKPFERNDVELSAVLSEIRSVPGDPEYGRTRKHTRRICFSCDPDGPGGGIARSELNLSKDTFVIDERVWVISDDDPVVGDNDATMTLNIESTDRIDYGRPQMHPN